MSNINDFVIEDGVLKEYKGEGGDVVIPDSVTAIGYSAFDGCKKLTIHAPSGSCTQKYALEHNIKEGC